MAKGLSGGIGATVAVVAFALLLVVEFGVLCYCFYRRAYLPLRYCKLKSMYVTYGSMVMTFIGCTFAGGYQAVHKEWAICAVTLGWIGMALGVLIFTAMFQMRLYQFLFVFVWKQRAEGLYFIIPTAYIFLLSTIYAAMAFMMQPSIGFAYDPVTNGCVTQNPIYYTGLVIVIIQAGICGGLLYKIRKAESCFGEFKKFAIIYGVSMLSGVIALAMRIVAQNTGKLVLAGIVTIVVVCLSQQVYFWMILGYTVYNCARFPQAYQSRFVETIDTNGLSEVYELACRYPLGEIASMSEIGRSRNVSARHSNATGSSRFSGNIPAPEPDSKKQPTKPQQPAPEGGEALSYYGM
ncbi:hypothetical protein GGI20_000738 [Coemansia sp. BCRC 34301]|nr:hypothetical protein GGI20_000738 [Coemansia sp. BCRC 34301]